MERSENSWHRQFMTACRQIIENVQNHPCGWFWRFWRPRRDSLLNYRTVHWTVLPFSCELRSGKSEFVSNPKLKKINSSVELFIFFGAEGGIRTHAPFRTNGFQDRLVMTASISLQTCFAIIQGSEPFVKDFFKFLRRQSSHSFHFRPAAPGPFGLWFSATSLILSLSFPRVNDYFDFFAEYFAIVFTTTTICV